MNTFSFAVNPATCRKRQHKTSTRTARLQAEQRNVSFAEQFPATSPASRLTSYRRKVTGLLHTISTETRQAP
jgi:hypothetical protein